MRPMSLSAGDMPQLVRYPQSELPEPTKLTPRERKLYFLLAVLLSLNLSVIFGALTFFGLLLGT
jgi:hypothetical protein